MIGIQELRRSLLAINVNPPLYLLIIKRFVKLVLKKGMRRMIHKKFKRGTILLIESKFGNGETQQVVGFYWMNEANKKRFVLVQEYPPTTFQGKLWSKLFVSHDLVLKITKLTEGK